MSTETPSDGSATAGTSPLVGQPARQVPAAPSEGPTTDCPTCGRTAKLCNNSHAQGWDGCCMRCDEAGRIATHRLRAVMMGGER